MNICIMTGARPNFVKAAPIMHAIDKAKANGQNINGQLVFAGSKDDTTLEASLFDDLKMREPDAYLNVKCENLNELTGQVMSAFEKYLQQHKTDAVIVVDDLASTMAAAIVAKKQGLLLAHLVAGTRSFDINMPKEINRLVIDGLSDLLFTAGIGANCAVTKEGAEQSKVYMVGNILMDTLRMNMPRLKRPELLDKAGLGDGQYIVFTLNRKALISDTDNLCEMLKALAKGSGKTPIIAPLRPLAAEAIKQMDAYKALPEGKLTIVKPLPYLEFGYITAHAKGIVTDSGNVAEEATFNGVPCITLNSYTEHIETVKIGTNILVGENPGRLEEEAKKMSSGQWKQSSVPERWDGRTADRIISILLEKGKGLN